MATIETIGPYPLNSIITGDARELAKRIPDESVDLIFTDPVYDRIEDYRWLAETAARVLKPNSAILVWIATLQLENVLRAMCPPLNYTWQLILRNYGTPYPGKTGICIYTSCLWLCIGKSKILKSIADYSDSLLYGRVELPVAKNGHIWGKSPDVIGKWLNAFSLDNSIIFDPFTGGGTVPAVCKMLGRNYIAFEIDPDVAERARERVRNTQPPLFVLQPEQVEMELSNGDD